MLGILTDKDLLKIHAENPDFISPFHPKQVKENPDGSKVISYGLDSMGYDVCLGNTFKVIKPTIHVDENILREKQCYTLENGVMKRHENAILDPKNLKVTYDLHEEDYYFILPPHSFVLAVTKESFSMPKNVYGLLTCKSTYARVGINMASTGLKSGWSGELVLEIFNQTNLPVKLYVNEGIGTIAFFASEEDPNGVYDGVYNGQTGVTTAKV